VSTVHLAGTFGTVREPVDADFAYFGETIRVNPDANDLSFMDLMEKARGIDLAGLDPDDPSTWNPAVIGVAQDAGNAAMDTIREQIHPDDWGLFFTTAKRNRQTIVDLMATSQQLSEMVTELVAGNGFPTGRSSDSTAGRSSTGQKSKGGSSSREQRVQRDTTQALRVLRGRPDLQAGVLRAEQARLAG